MDPNRHHRAFDPRPGDRIHVGHQVQARRQPAIPVQDLRLWSDLDPDHRRHPRRRLHSRNSGGPDQAWPPLRWHGDRRVRVIRRRRLVAAASAKHAHRAHLGPGGQGQRPRSRNQRSLLLDTRRPDSPPAGDFRPCQRHAPLSTGNRRPNDVAAGRRALRGTRQGLLPGPRVLSHIRRPKAPNGQERAQDARRGRKPD